MKPFAKRIAAPHKEQFLFPPVDVYDTFAGYFFAPVIPGYTDRFYPVLRRVLDPPGGCHTVSLLGVIQCHFAV